MRLGILLFLASFSLLAAGDTIDYSGAGSLSNGTATQAGSPTAGRSWSVTDQLVEIDDTTTNHNQQGDLGHVDITTGKLMACTGGLCFTGGSLDITSNNGTTLVDVTFISGMVTKSHGNTFLNASLTDGGTTQIESTKGVFSSNSVISTRSHVTPESSSLFLLGTGLVGLWFLGRERLKCLGRASKSNFS